MQQWKMMWKIKAKFLLVWQSFCMLVRKHVKLWQINKKIELFALFWCFSCDHSLLVLSVDVDVSDAGVNCSHRDTLARCITLLSPYLYPCTVQYAILASGRSHQHSLSL